jgi:pyrroline-5-carboxylate reductase
MATALARALVDAEVARAEQVVASDPLQEATDAFAEAVAGAKIAASNAEAARDVDVLVLAVKPNHVLEALRSVRGNVTDRTLVVSIAAGVTIECIDEGLGGGGRIVRVMPNSPCLVRQGASGYCLGPRTTADDGPLVDRLLRAVGIAVSLPQRLLDAVTGLSGSGPAFVFVMIEALADGGVLAGLPRPVAMALATQTVLGAAEMVRTTGEHPAQLKDRVASAGGTTIAGLAVLEAGGVRASLIDAVAAAARRSAELGALPKSE